MDKIKALYKSFSKSEIRVFKDYLTAFHKKGENKPLKLIRMIEKNPSITAWQAAEKLYGDPKSKGFIMMKSRLLDKMSEFLSLSVNPASPKPDPESPFSYDLIEFRKLMLQAAVFRSRRMNHLAVEALEKAAAIAQQDGCPELEIDALLRLRGLRSGQADPEELDELTLRIREAIPRQNADINGAVSYQRFLEQHTLRLSDDAAKIRFLEEHIPRLETSLLDTYSVRADYYLKTLKVNYFSIKGQYEACKETILSVVDLVGRHRGLINRQRIATPYLQLGLLELKFHNYEEALSALDTCSSHLKKGSPGYFRATLLKMYAYIFRGELDLLEKVAKELDELQKKRSARTSPRIVGMFTYLKACAAYLSGQPGTAWRILQEISELNFDKGGWLTGIRIFEIMLLIDQREFDIASQKLENLRKHLGRHEVVGRFDVIFKLLAQLERNAWSFQGVNKAEDYLQRLQEKFPWQHLGSETIRFDDWFRNHKDQPANL